MIPTGYLTIVSSVDIVYEKWVALVKAKPVIFKSRTGGGTRSDGISMLPFALMPLSVLLSSREFLLSLITSIPDQHFNFLPCWWAMSYFCNLLCTHLAGRLSKLDFTTYRHLCGTHSSHTSI